MTNNQDFTDKLLSWYDQEARTLPWRSEPTPYRVWISEMMLQQTRVDTVIPYFDRFITELPDIPALAEVDEDKLLKLWQGLGYYSRAMNLKKAAMMIQKDHGGILPSDRRTLQKLPGIGPYSAGAISSIAFQKIETLMDGNVLRVVARLYGIEDNIDEKGTRDRVQQILENLISRKRPGDFNQAMMELGATRCLPNGEPLCDACPVKEMCVASRENKTAGIPVKTPKKPREIQNWTVLLLRRGNTVGIEKRIKKGLLANMWAFPMLEGHLCEDACRQQLESQGFAISSIHPLPKSRHIFTHIEWNMTGYLIEVSPPPSHDRLLWTTREEMADKHAIPTAHAFYVKQLDL